VITETVEAKQLTDLGRLDAWYFLSPGAAASRRVNAARSAGVATQRLGGTDGLARVWAPARFKRSYAAPGEGFIGYLRAHDIFRYLPTEVDRLSIKRTRTLDRYRVKEGTILQTCSGRNLGPSAVADRHLAGFALTHDLVRIEVEDPRLRFYLLAFLKSPTGQGVLRRDKSGSVIDHISVEHVEDQEVPLLDGDAVDEVVESTQRASELIEGARMKLSGALRDYEAELPSPTRLAPSKGGWSIPFSEFSGRIDAAPYDPWIRQIQEELEAAGGMPVSELAEVLKPPGRYKTFYVGSDHGLPFLSGTQILQLEVINPQFMAAKTFKDPALYELREGWSVYQADGRAEEALGFPAYVPSDRDGWVASGHVGRLIPRPGTDPGWLWLAAATWQVQAQIKALASGSVVDSTYPVDMANIVLPPPDPERGKEVAAAWQGFSEARRLQGEASAGFEHALTEIAGVGSEGE
jgi:hypothetical protein